MSNESETLYRFTTADAEAILRRPLVHDEADLIRKTLEHALGDVVEQALDPFEAVETLEFGAAGIEDGHIIREFGMNDWYTITKVDWHGDTILLTGLTVDNDEEEFTLDGDATVQLLVTGP